MNDVIITLVIIMKKILVILAVIITLTLVVFCGCADDKKTLDDNGSSQVTNEQIDNGIAEEEPENDSNSEIIDSDDEVDAEANETDKKEETEKKNKIESAEKAKAEAEKKAKEEAEKKAKSQKKPGQKPQNQPKKEEPKTEPQQLPWPSNEYTKWISKPAVGVLKETAVSDGIYCMLFSGVSISDAKSYAAGLISSGYTNDVSETISGGTYLFGGGNSSGVFAVVNYNSGQMMIGVQV